MGVGADKARLFETIKTPVVKPDGTVIGVLGVARDITQRREHEQTILEQDRLLKEMGALARIGAWELDVASGALQWTDEVSRIFDTALGQPSTLADWLARCEGEDRVVAERALEAAVARGELFTLELEIVSRAGNRKWIRMLCSAVMADGRVLKLRGTVQDVTQRRTLEESIRMANLILPRTAVATPLNNLIQNRADPLHLEGGNRRIFDDIASLQTRRNFAMAKRIHRTALVAMLLAASAWASAAATVTYANTEKMADVPRHQADRELMEEQLIELLNALSAKLPGGQQLKVEILDIDLAGDVFPRVAVQNVRVLKGQGDPPRIHLRYSIEQDGKVLSSGERKLTNHAYQTAFNRYSNEMFSHEKQLLDDWFKKEIVAAR